MSDHAHGRADRECRSCGACLAAWQCATCGASALEQVASAYIADLATAWRPGSRKRADERSGSLGLAA